MSLGITALSRLLKIEKQAEIIRMKEAVIQSQGKTIMRMRQDNEKLRDNCNRANVYVAVSDALRAIANESK